ncbi:CBS domain protein [Azoarcus indigens]|uniref:CBS domain protein n=2 Tax=Azoarcus indigens TaxID=29545 RepID=A0A4R6DXA9_9RHOO|nr:CBS domain protein [Azoarcus indigens]
MLRERFEPMRRVELTGMSCSIADVIEEGRVHLDSPAIEVMTDLKRIPAASLAAAESHEEALRVMQMRGVRLLLVVDGSDMVVGVVTAADLLGERPLRAAREQGLRRGEVMVARVMTPLSAMDAVRYEDVLRAEVGDVIATLGRSGRQHALVIEIMLEGRVSVRGIFSRTQIARQLRVALPEGTEIARNFAEIEAAIAA